MAKEKTIEERLDRLEALLGAMKTVLNIKEAAAFLGRSESYIKQLCQTDKLPYYTPQGQAVKMFRRADLERWATAEKCPLMKADEYDLRRHSRDEMIRIFGKETYKRGQEILASI